MLEFHFLALWCITYGYGGYGVLGCSKFSNRWIILLSSFPELGIKLAGYWECKLLLCYCNWLCLLAGALSLLIDIRSSSCVNIVAVSFFSPALFKLKALVTKSTLHFTYFILIRVAYKLNHTRFKIILSKCERRWNYLPYLVYLLYWELKSKVSSWTFWFGWIPRFLLSGHDWGRHL